MPAPLGSTVAGSGLTAAPEASIRVAWSETQEASAASSRGPVDRRDRVRSPLDRREAAGPLRVALVNDYEIIVRGLHAMLAPFGDRIVVVEHEIGGTPEASAEIALFDTFAGRRDAIDRAAHMARDGVVDDVVLYTWDAPAEFLEAARSAGVSAVVLKSVSGIELVETLERVAVGERAGLDLLDDGESGGPSDRLSVREQEVLAMLALGLGNAEIADELFLSPATVKTHVARILDKLGLRDRVQAVVRAYEVGLAPS